MKKQTEQRPFNTKSLSQIYNEDDDDEVDDNDENDNNNGNDT